MTVDIQTLCEGPVSAWPAADGAGHRAAPHAPAPYGDRPATAPGHGPAADGTPEPGVDRAAFRQVMARFPSFVTVITSATPDGPSGCTATAVLSLSLEPASVLVSLRTAGRTLAHIRESGAFAVNVLSWEQRSLAGAFATGDPRRRFDRVRHSRTHGVPVLDGCAATVVCDLSESVDLLDHTLLIGTARHASSLPHAPMVLLDGVAGQVAEPVDPAAR
ncbi:NADH-dependent flavin reductase [Streptomyces sp. ADI96-02]|uniref:flavin reductase family protein n=1 Tax=unclassified Streptomyces TaxID=2593676 RepID=UPI000F5528C1|nr:flavin reductase family protein [Streptomyces sp. ADI96-02]RPK65813.1 NADH-dependent flavin reductase [Streptomyces sp. ADI96-02]